MKKYFLAFVATLCVLPVFAVTLSGKVVDGLTGKGVSDVTVGIGESPKPIKTDNDGNFKIKNYTPPNGDEFSQTNIIKSGYVDNGGTISLEKDGTLSYGDVHQDEVIFEKAEGSTTYKAKSAIKLFPEPKEIFRGKIFIEEDGEHTLKKEEIVFWVDDANNTNITKYEIIGKDPQATSYEYIVKGYLGTEADPITYTANIEHPGFKPVTDKLVVVGNEKLKDVDIKIKNLTGPKKREDNMKRITGFDCSELMPKYLVGANCVDNSSLEGDATDLAAWIQKFGGKITSMIGMIAVVLIVWNAFSIVTAAGDEEKISKGKKGIMWTILGLALTMFAYVIVKTVIMLTYTQ